MAQHYKNESITLSRINVFTGWTGVNPKGNVAPGRMDQNLCSRLWIRHDRSAVRLQVADPIDMDGGGAGGGGGGGGGADADPDADDEFDFSYTITENNPTINNTTATTIYWSKFGIDSNAIFINRILLLIYIIWLSNK